MQPREFLRQTPPFDSLDDNTLQTVASSLKIVHYPAGMRILERGGEPSHYLYIIRKGAVRLEQDGHPALLLEEGDLFGFPSLIAQNPPLFDVIVEEESEIYQLHETIFRHLLQQAPAFADYFLRGLGERLRRTATFQPQSALAFGDFTAPVSELIQRQPIFVEPGITVAEAARVMHQHGISSVLVASDPPGIVTVRDLRSRVLAAEKPPSIPVHRIMTAPLFTIPANTAIIDALLAMIDKGIHHLPIEENGRIIGLITDTDLIRLQIRNPLILFERVRAFKRMDDIANYGRDLAATVDWLFRNGMDVIHIGQVVARLNDTLTSRLLMLAEQALGPAPTSYAWFVFGSEGRMEQLLLTDQDNALAYAAPSPEMDSYFAQLAQRVVDGLITLGFPPCAGGYMATHWRRPIDEWTRLFRSWIEAPTPQALMEVGIFFDFRRVHGTLSLKPLEDITREGGERRMFLAHMARAAQTWQPPLGLFRRIRGDRGRVDLKRGGIAPIVALARVYALESLSNARSTVERLRVAREKGILSQDGGETLEEAFRFLMRLRLQAQLEALHQGGKPDNTITLKNLSSLEQRMLKETFLAIRNMQEALRFRYQTDLLG